MNLELHLRIVGLLQIALAAAHAPMPRWFGWRGELAAVSPLNRQIFLVHNFFIGLVVALIGAASLCAPAALVEPSRLGLLVCAGLTAFWLIRLIVQFFVYESRLWRGDARRTGIHIAFSLFWSYLSAVYIAALMRQLAQT